MVDEVCLRREFGCAEQCVLHSRDERAVLVLVRVEAVKDRHVRGRQGAVTFPSFRRPAPVAVPTHKRRCCSRSCGDSRSFARSSCASPRSTSWYSPILPGWKTCQNARRWSRHHCPYLMMVNTKSLPVLMCPFRYSTGREHQHSQRKRVARRSVRRVRRALFQDLCGGACAADDEHGPA